jgi:hypothetical protein
MENLPGNSSEQELVVPDRRARLDVQAKFFDAHPELITPRHLNNLYAKLFGAAERKTNEMRKKGMELRPTINLNSEKRRAESLEEHYAEIDEAVAGSDIDTEEMERLLADLEEARLRGDHKTYDAISQDINGKLLDLYRVLRERGYNHYDIIQ